MIIDTFTIARYELISITHMKLNRTDITYLQVPTLELIAGHRDNTTHYGQVGKGKTADTTIPASCFQPFEEQAGFLCLTTAPSNCVVRDASMLRIYIFYLKTPRCHEKPDVHTYYTTLVNATLAAALDVH